jgi:hypothetical protein
MNDLINRNRVSKKPLTGTDSPIRFRIGNRSGHLLESGGIILCFNNSARREGAAVRSQLSASRKKRNSFLAFAYRPNAATWFSF